MLTLTSPSDSNLLSPEILLHLGANDKLYNNSMESHAMILGGVKVIGLLKDSNHLFNSLFPLKNVPKDVLFPPLNPMLNTS